MATRNGTWTMLRRIGIGTVSAATVTVLVAPAAMAGGYINTYDSFARCQDEGIAQAAAAGGPANGVTHYCEEVKGASPGVAGCPVEPGTDGCLGNYWNLYLN